MIVGSADTSTIFLTTAKAVAVARSCKVFAFVGSFAYAVNSFANGLSVVVAFVVAFFVVFIVVSSLPLRGLRVCMVHGKTLDI